MKCKMQMVCKRKEEDEKVFSFKQIELDKNWYFFYFKQRKFCLCTT